MRSKAIACVVALTLGAGGATLAQAQEEAPHTPGAEQPEAERAEEEKVPLAELPREHTMELQERLQEEGTYDGEVDGVADEQTVSALRDFQDREDLEGDGKLTQETAERLDLDFEEIQRVRGVEPEEREPQIEEPGEYEPGTGEEQNGNPGEGERNDEAWPGEEEPEMAPPAEEEPREQPEGVQLQELDEDQVRDLQQQLQELGHYDGEVDGIPGPLTRSALHQFYSEQAQMAAQGQITTEGAEQFGLDVEPVVGEEPEEPREEPEEPREEPEPREEQPQQ